MKKVKRKLLVIAVALMFVAMMVAPVMAKSPKKIPVGLFRTGYGVAPPAESWTTNGDTYHARDGLVTWSDYNIMNVDSEGNPIGDKVACEEGTYQMTMMMNRNNKSPFIADTPYGPLPLDLTHSKFHVEIDFGDGNTFKGIMTGRSRGYIHPITGMRVQYEMTQKTVAHGTGIYQGWTLVWERYRTDGGPTIYRTIYMLVP